MSKMKKVLIFCVILSLLAALITSCASEDDKSKSPDVSKPGGEDQEQEDEDVPSDDQPEGVTVIKAMYMDPNWTIPEWGEDPVTKKFTEMTGVQLDFSVPQGEADQVANVMLVSGDYPPLMWINRGPVYEKYVAAGALHAVDELAEKYNYPKILEEYIPENTVKYLKKSDGHLYIIPNWFSEDGFGTIGMTFNYRMDIYEELGSPELKTIDDLYNYFVSIRDAKLEFEGVKVYPFGFAYNIDNISFLANLWGNKIRQLCYEDEAEKKIKFMLRNEDVLNAIKFLNRLYKEELMEPEVLTYSSTQRREAYTQGKFAVVYDAFWGLWTPNAALQQIDPSVYYKAMEPPQGTPGKQQYLGTTETVGWNGAVITKNCTDVELEKAMKWFDYYLSPEGETLTFYGVEGISMEYVDGKPMLKEEVYDAWRADAASCRKEYGVRVIDLNQNQAYNWERHQEAPERQADRRIAEAFSFDCTPLFVLYIDPTTEEGILLADIQAGLLNELTKMITEPDPNNIETLYNKLLQDYERRGLAKVEEAWTKQYYEKEE